MPELHDGPMIEDHEHPSKIAVAICSSRSGFYALKWALEKEVPAHGLVYLLHVQSPIRWIPNAMGGEFPVDQVRPDIVQKFKSQRDSEAEKLANQYRKICDKKKIKSDVCYSESNSVQKELVDQISNLGITKLVLGTSQGAFARALRVESVSAYVAKHAPGFCEVLVVNKEKLCHFKRGTQAPADLVGSSSSSISDRIGPTMGSDEDVSRTSNDIGSRDRRTWSGVTEDMVSASPSPGSLLDFSQSYPERRLPHSMSSNGALYSHQINMMKRVQSANSASRLSELGLPSTPFGHPRFLPGYSVAQLDIRQESEASISFNETVSTDNGFLDRIDTVHTYTPVAINCDNYVETSERNQYPDSKTLSQVGALSMVATPSPQRPSHAHENGLLSPGLSFRIGSAHHNHQTHMLRSIPSAPPASLLSEFSPSTPFDQPCDSPGHTSAQLDNRRESEASPFNGSHSIEDRFFVSSSNYMVHAFTPVATNCDNYKAMETPERMQYPNFDTLSQMGDLSITETPATQRPSSALENGLPSPAMPFANGSAVVAPEADLLQNQLNEAKLFAEGAQKEAEWQTSFLFKAQEVAASAKKMVVEHERRRLEASREAQKAMQQATKDARRCEEAILAQKLAQKDQERLQRELAEEVEKHQRTRMELETQKRIADVHATEAALAKQQVEAERRRCEKTALKLGELRRKLEIECQLRTEAEEKASLEAAAKLDALASLRRERQRYSEYSYEELQAATNGFHEENKLGEGGYGPVYRGKLHHTSVAIKVLARDRSRGREEFQREVEVLSRIRHPHMLMLLGACPEKGCIVYEYMANGSLEDRLNCKDGTPPLPWYARFRICFEVATALLFFHSQPQPIVHRDLKPGNILLDHHFVSKIGDVGLAKLVPEDLTFNGATMYRDTIPVGTFAYIDPDYQRTGVVSRESDVYALGVVMLQLLTGKPAVGITHLVETADKAGKLGDVLDKSAGDWSLEEARQLACISLKCTAFKRRDRPSLEMDILPILESLQNVAESAAANMASLRPSSSGTSRPIVPSFFFCPILQEIMEDPCMAADGFTYEHHAIRVWLQANNTSPMTNLRLEHKNLMPNYTLRSAIREWHDNGLI